MDGTCMVDNWRQNAACRGQDPNDYIPEKQNKKDTKHYDKTTCASCPVQTQCLDYALANRAKKGLWGGTTPKQREKMYSQYEGERHYELDLDKLLFPKPPQDPEKTPKPRKPKIHNPLAPASPLHFTWVTEIYIQGSLFDRDHYKKTLQ